MRSSGSVLLLGLALTTGQLCGCAAPLIPRDTATGSSGHTIGEETIARYGVTNAWEVLRKSGYFLVSRDDGPDGPIGVRSKRGKTSFLLAGSDVPRVMVDGAPLGDLRLLRDLPANSIAWIQIFSGIEATMMEGTNSGGGLILIVTKAGS
ncbi:MAG TPA: hypothetical protein VM053_07020 [Gemmatimonadaceae bacterium]|nr:hypothetical protein [Gemmatimonadaceae bacterium]